MPVSKRRTEITPPPLRPYWQSDCGRATVYVGDCREVLAGLDPEQFHTVVTDPPYGLEFMGKEWDAPWKNDAVIETCADNTDQSHPFRDGTQRVRYGNKTKKIDAKNRRADEMGDPVKAKYLRHNVEYVRDSHLYQEWFHTCAEAILRVAKPGAHLLSFGGTRMFHRMACAVEDAGWEIRDTIMWVYGCLSDDTELLTARGWVHYSKIKIGSLALGYDLDSDSFQWQPIQEVFTYACCETAYQIVSERTNQIVSRNHRCIVEQGGVRTFARAEDIARQREASVSILEDLQGLLEAVSLSYQGASSSQQDVWSGMRCECNQGTAQEETDVREEDDGDCLRSVWQDSVESELMVEKSQDADLLTPVQRCAAREGTNQAQSQRTEWVVWQVSGQQQTQNDWTRQSSLEWRRDLFQEARQLWQCEICTMPNRVHADVSQGWLRWRTSTVSSTSNRSVSNPEGSGSPRGPRPNEQHIVQFDTVCFQQGPQTIRSAGFTRTTVARIEPIYYEGIVWCIRIQSGAFVARRNGKVFVTGNSGFPKSHDISKAIDRVHGVERVETDVKKRNSALCQGSVLNKDAVDGGYGFKEVFGVSEAVTDDAKRWAGWGSALKPAFEPVVCARKPLEGSTAQNTLEHGCGGLNIGACRVGADTITTQSKAHRDSPQSNLGLTSFAGCEASQHEGRWPANVVHDGSDEVLTAFPNTQSQRQTVTSVPGDVYGGGNGLPSHTGTYGFDDSGSAARLFYSAKADEGDRPHGKDSTVHPTVKPLDLMRYLVRLVCVRGGTVLDPFMGSGSTGCAALAEGMHFVGVEQSQEYADIAVGRLKLALQTAPSLTALKTREAVNVQKGTPPSPTRIRLE